MIEISRPLKDEELNFIKELISLSGSYELLNKVPQYIIELDDGGMGSLRFDVDRLKKYSSDLIEVEYLDSDNIPVSIVLMLDKEGDLFELDFFKADFSKLQTYPTIEKVKRTLS